MTPSATQARSRGRAGGAIEPLAHRALGAVGLFDFGHHQTGARRRPRRAGIAAQQRRQRRRAPLQIVRVDRSAGDGQLALDVERRDARQGPRARQPVGGRIAGPHAQIDGGEIGVRRRPVRRLENFRRAAIIARRRRQPPGERGGGNEAGRERASFLRERERALGVALGLFLREGGLQHGAPAIGGRRVEQLRGSIRFDGRERARPVAVRGAVFEHRLRRPWQGGVFVGPRGVGERRLVIAGPARLDMQPAQAERLGRRMFEHLVERRDGARAVARKLRGLRAKELGQRLLGEELARFARRAVSPPAHRPNRSRSFRARRA